MNRIFFLPLLLLNMFASVSVFGAHSSVSEAITEVLVNDNDSAFRYSYYYDENGNKVLETKYFLDGNLWTRLSQIEWVYADGKCLHQVERIFDKTVWRNRYGISYKYSVNDLVTETRYGFTTTADTLFDQKISYSKNSQIASSRAEYTYENNAWRCILKNEVSVPKQLSDTNWVYVYDHDVTPTASYRSVNTYYSHSGIKTQLQQVLENGVWISSKLVSWYYTSDGSKLVSVRTKQWDRALSRWDNLQKEDYEYDTSGNLLSETYMYWNQMCWVSDLRYDYMSDASSNILQKNVSAPIYDLWRKLISVDYSDFQNGIAHKMTSSYNFWGGINGESASSYIPFQFNGEVMIKRAQSIELKLASEITQGSFLPDERALSLKVFPNPSDGVFYIESFNGRIDSWVVVDLSGRVFKSSQEQVFSGVVDITEMPKGVYLLKAQTNNGTITQKIIKN